MRWATIWDARLMIIRFLQFMGISLSLFLAGTFMFGWLHAHGGGDGNIQRWSFDLFDLVHLSLEPATASILFFLLFYGLAIRIPIFPMHGWLPLFITHGNIAVGPILFLGLKVGIYGLIRFILPLLPDAVMQWQELIIGMALFGIFYAAFLATRQNNLRRLLAFAIISHSSILLIALFSLNKEGFMGSIFLALNFGLAISSLLVMTGLIWQRTNTIDINKLGGLFNIIPFVGVAFLLASLAIIGMPLTPGFDGVHLMLEASIHRFGGLVAIAASIGNVIAAAFLLRAFQRAFLSPPKKTVSWDISPMYFTEIVLAGTVIIATLSVGFYSKPWLELIDTATEPLGAFYDELNEKQKTPEREDVQEHIPSPLGKPITIPVHTKGI
jgi:NADH-quinone oxidoreductase subunit M